VPAPISRGELLKGARFGAHEIVSLRGHGATASVFEGRHVTLGKSVAVKVLHEHLAADEQIAGRFVREGRVAARLRHPNAVEVYDVGVEQGIPYLVMELLVGGDLRTLLADVGKLDVEHTLRLLLPIASALAYAHDAGVIHRDLKPANIVLARDVRDDVVPKLVDFGLSKAAGVVDASPTLTEMVAGTLLYMAPEQTLGMKFATAASDQYSLGAIVYEALTGRPPFLAESLQSIIEQIRAATAVPPSALAVAIPRALDAIVLRALSREPAARFPSVREFARALLPFASPATASAFERDFSDRASARMAASRSSVRRTKAHAPSSGRTRVETPELAPTRIESPASSPVSARREADPPASARREPETPISMRREPEPPMSMRRETDRPPPLPCAPGASPFHVKGNPYRGLLHAAENLPGGIDTLCDALDDPRLRDFVRQPFLATSRYDVLPMYPISYALARLAGRSFDAYVREGTAAQARYDARTAYRRIFDGAAVNDIPDRIARFNANYYDFGEFVGSVAGEHEFAIEYRATPAYFYPWYGRMNEAYTLESAKILGARDVIVRRSKPASGGMRGVFELVTFRVEVRWK
jgi:serine/threonine protein kinase